MCIKSATTITWHDRGGIIGNTSTSLYYIFYFVQILPRKERV